MAYAEGNTDRENDPTKLLIICRSTHEAEVRRLITRFAYNDWQNQSKIQVRAINERRRFFHKLRSLGNEIDTMIPPHSFERVLFVEMPVPQIPWGNRAHRKLTLHEFGQDIKHLLFGCQCHWRNEIQEKLNGFDFQQFSEKDVEQWLKQFEIFGTGTGKRWIGESLLRGFDFWSTSRLCGELFGKPEEFELQRWLNGADIVVCDDPTRGGSGAKIASACKNFLGSDETRRKLKTLPEFDSACQTGVLNASALKVLLIEDCLLSGSQCIDRIRDTRLKDVSALEIRCGVVTAFGAERVKEFSKSLNISNVWIAPPKGGVIQNLSEDAAAALAKGRSLSGWLSLSMKSPILDGIALRTRPFLNSDEVEHARRFCTHICRCLVAERLRRLGEAEGAVIRAVEKNGLGKSNLGLLLAFAHRVPDGSLPLFSYSGRVVFENKSCDWKPLFSPRPIPARDKTSPMQQPLPGEDFTTAGFTPFDI
jgi:hypothetical protein